MGSFPYFRLAPAKPLGGPPAGASVTRTHVPGHTQTPAYGLARRPQTRTHKRTHAHTSCVAKPMPTPRFAARFAARSPMHPMHTSYDKITLPLS